MFVVRLICRNDAQVLIKNQERRHFLQNGVGIVARLLGLLLAALERINAHQHQHRAVDLVVERHVGAYPQRIPAALIVAHLALALADAVDDIANEWLERVGQCIGQVARLLFVGFAGPALNQIVADAAQRAADVGGEKIENLLCRKREAANRQVASEQQNRRVNIDLKIVQIAVQPVQFDIAVGHLFIDGRQLFVGRLEFFFRRFELFIDAL